jgi:hypothetical protein
MSYTRNPRDLVANLRHIANILESSGIEELAEPVSVYVSLNARGLTPARGPELVDQIAGVTGAPAAFEPGSGWDGNRAWLGTKLTQETWTLHCSVLAVRPDPAEQLRIENEQLRKALGKIKKIASKHTSADGCECEDCAALTEVK